MQNITLPEKIVIISIIFLVLIIGGGAYMLLTQPNSPSSQLELSPQALIDSVSKIAELPPEQPTIATVTDKERLASFSFFSQAQIGDRVLIFNEAKKAYLYRPSTNKIVEVGPILIAEETEPEAVVEIPVTPPEASVAASQIEPATITLLNGTRGKGVALAAEKELNNNELNIEVKVKGNSKKNYTQTKIAVTNKLSTSEAEHIAKLLNAEIVELPVGEVAPKTDIVVFLGTDRL